ncbi:MAG TPA: sigma 54-interacting transcriptional regulator [Terriglobales bacterium]|jgi:formate hydrogenlyase transcriptional activator|nr:sigma 54-interacting transcriptional regulator [Terriglobales bacterium]
MSQSPQPAADASAEQRYRALLEVTDAIAPHDNLDQLLRDLAYRLRKIVRFDSVSFVLHDPAANLMRLVHAEAFGEELPLPPTMSIEDSASGRVWRTGELLVMPDLQKEQRLGPVLKMLQGAGFRSCCVLPMTVAERRLGALAMASRQENAYGDADLEFLKRVAEQVAVAIDNVAQRQQALTYQQQLASERDRLRLLLEVNNVLISNREIRDLFPAISDCLRKVVAHDYASLAVLEPGGELLRLHALVFPEGKGLVHQELVFAKEGSPGGWTLDHRRPLLADPLTGEQYPAEITARMISEGVRCAVWLPLTTRNTILGTLGLASLHEHAFRAEDVALLAQVASQIAIALENALAFGEIAQLKDKLAQEKLYLQEEIHSEYNFEEIVGESRALQTVLQQVETVAPTGATVLILGETGTGKELIARAIHDLSTRREHTFVKLSCAAIPTGLLESELFGHEKGAFTGAIVQKIGRLELAHKGTLFLDEVGDIPLELQPKLLRALQEREFERLGSTRTQQVDTRVVAATNRDLAKMVEEGSFRRDLYYRLNVFPVRIPPLRERREDIPLLVRYFAQKFSRTMNRRIETIPSETMDALVNWAWPGNVRELEHMVERAVILSPGPILNVPVAELRPTDGDGTNLERLDDAEREHILRVLREAGGVIGGATGAANRLGLKRTTLHFKMKKLGISRADL